MFIYLQKLLHCLTIYSYIGQIHRFQRVHEICDQSDQAILNSACLKPSPRFLMKKVLTQISNMQKKIIHIHNLFSLSTIIIPRPSLIKSAASPFPGYSFKSAHPPTRLTLHFSWIIYAKINVTIKVLINLYD